MNKAYTIIKFTQDDAIAVLDGDSQTTIVLQEYSDEKYKTFLGILETWDLLFVDDSWEEEGIETNNYSSHEDHCEKRLPLGSENLLINNGEVVGFVLGKRHYPNWKIPKDTVLMFFDGTSIGPTEYEDSYIWGDRPSETTFYHNHYTYKLAKKETRENLK